MKWSIEKSISQSEERFATAFRVSPAPLSVTRVADGRFVDVNDSFLGLFGYGRDEVIGQTAVELRLFFDPGTAADLTQRLRDHGSVRDYETVARTKSGDNRNVLFSIEMLNSQGEGLLLAIIFDITERRRAEEAVRQNTAELERRVQERTAQLAQVNVLMRESEVRFRTAVETMLDGFAIFSAVRNEAGRIVDFHYEYINEAGCQINGLPRADHLGHTLSEMPFTHHEVDLFDAYVRVAETGASFGTESLIYAGTDDDRQVARAFEIRVAQLGDGFSAVWRDVTKRKQLFQELERARLEAETANRAKSEFLSRMSHELRTPLNAILGFAQIMEMDSPGERQRENIRHILNGGQHLLALINEVLDIARIEAGRMTLSPEPVLVTEIIDEVLDLVRPLATQRQIRIETAETPEQYVLADRQRFKQVLLNLLSNAIKYNQVAGMVSISTRSSPDGRQQILVRDTGPGIPLEKQARVFIPFDRLDAEKTDIEGTGLGLTLARRLMDAMGGGIGLESMIGQGSTFWVELPVAESPLERAKRAAPTVGLSARTLTSAKTVLYVEDNLSNLKLAEEVFFYRPNLVLLPAMQGRLGLDLAREHQPHLILLDLNLPDVHGSDVLQQLQADPRTSQIPIVVISADATPNQIDRLLKAGARAYLTKPFDLQHFLGVIDELLK